MSGEPALIALDWGTTSLRAHLLDVDGAVLDTRSGPWGVLQVPHGDFRAVYDAATREWPLLNALSAGMIGSTRGWLEVPYCTLPAGATELAARITHVPDTALHIVPGVARTGDRPDVMRGEETQIVGVLEIEPTLAAHSTIVLPGTHSKWVTIVDSKITNLTTYMTGELYAVLRDHSILGGSTRSTKAHSDDAFGRGVRAARASTQGIAPALFSARSLVLTQQIASEDALAYLSGLLIGDEIRSGLAVSARPDALVGEDGLCRLYQGALAMFDVHDVAIVADASQAGLWQLARCAGLA